MTIMPASRPRLSTADLEARLDKVYPQWKDYPLVIVGIRGYYMRSMGDPSQNDRGIYDDAIFLHTSNVTAAFNANCDPSRGRPGMATLAPGFWPCYRFDLHHGRVKSYEAICQRAGPVAITRDGQPAVKSGMFGINIHCGGYWTTGSEGCQTLPPEQWKSFYALARSEAQRLFGASWKTAVVPYALFEEGKP